MIDTLFLDLDGVVLNFSFAERQAVSEMLEALHERADDAVVERYAAINKGLWEAHERGEITKAALKTERFVRLKSAFSLAAAPDRMAEEYVARLSRQGQLTEGAAGALRSLKGRYRLYAVTNGLTAVQKGRIAAAGIGNAFNGVFISEELGYVKPQKEFFDACLERCRARRERVLVVGDSLTADIAGANAAGLKCCLIGTAEPADGYRIDMRYESFKAFAESAAAGEII